MKHLLAVTVCAALLSACSTPRPPLEVAVELPVSWYAPMLPHQGSTAELAQWWRRFDDPLLTHLIGRAQSLSPSIASARAQVFAARATLLGAQAQGRPQLDAVASASRGVPDPTFPLGTTLSAGLQASWAIGLWGENQARVAGAQAREQASNAGWHEARVLVASELAQLYFAQRLCQEQLAVALRDRDSRAVTAQNSSTSERAGLTAPAVAALARASGAQSEARFQQQQAVCERQLKSLSALTGVAEPELRRQLASASTLPTPQRLDALLVVNAVPAEVIGQRPDVVRAQREWVAAGEDVGVARAALLPGLSLSGSLQRNRFTGGEFGGSFNTWSIGPISLRLPLLGRDSLRASSASAQARFDAAAVAYASTLRQAVAEVEQALVTLASLRERASVTETAVAGYEQSLKGTEARYRVGLANLNELEEARRLKLDADSSAVALQQERINAWIQLYVALGGGFDPVNTDNALESAP